MIAPKNPSLVTVAVLDTGLHAGMAAKVGAAHEDGIPDVTDVDGDLAFDRQSGHGSFISALIRKYAPGATMASFQVLNSWGVGSDATVTAALRKLLAAVDNKTLIINLSLGSYTMDDAGSLTVHRLLAEAMANGVVVVASAGNDSIRRPMYPAALPGVIGVAALNRQGAPARFTNFGSWVRACSLGTDIVSMFGSGDDVREDFRQKFEGWARWSGTSFAAPRVVAALARHRLTTGATLDEAVNTLIDAPDLTRLRCLGTVVQLG